MDTITITTSDGKRRMSREEYETLIRDYSRYAWIVDGVPIRPVVRRDGKEFELTSEEYEVLARLIRAPRHPVPFLEVKKLLGAETDASAEKRFNEARASVEPAQGDKKQTRAGRAFKHNGKRPDRVYAFEPSVGLAYALVERMDSALVPIPSDGRPSLGDFWQLVQDALPRVEIEGCECEGIRVEVQSCEVHPTRLEVELRVENCGQQQQVIDHLELVFPGQRLRCKRTFHRSRHLLPGVKLPRSKIPSLPTGTFALAAGEVRRGYLAFPCPDALKTSLTGEKGDAPGERRRTGGGALALRGTIELRLFGDDENL